MKTQYSENERIDMVASKLLRSAALRDDEVEGIAGDGGLFASVRARIISDSVTRSETPLRFGFMHRMVIATAAATVIVASIFAAVLISDRRGQTPTRRGEASLTTDALVQPNVQQPAAVRDPGPNEYEPFPAAAPVSQPHYIKTIEYRSMPDNRHVTPKQPPQIQDTPGEFYALADLHPSEEATTNGRIVRVELSRAALVALGVNIPLDSEKQFIKTDLLVGPDGVPRAIRLVE